MRPAESGINNGTSSGKRIMTTKRLSNGNDTYTTKIGAEAVYA